MRKKIADYIAEYLEKHTGHEEHTRKLANFIEDFITSKSEEDKELELLESFYEEIEEFTDELTEEDIAAMIKCFKHRDGSESGMKWTIEEIDSVATQYNAPAKLAELGHDFCLPIFWLAMNYVYATHFSVSRTINGYLELAIDELANKNVCFERLVKHLMRK